VRGRDNANLNDEGFLSSYHVRGHGFPRERPQGVADGALTEVVEKQLVSHVELAGNALVRYMFNEMKFRKEGHKRDQLDAKLANYTNLYCFASSFGNAACKANVLNQTSDWAPKLEQIVDLVAESARKQQKAVVMISRKNGFTALLELVKQRGHIDGFGVCDDSARADFNESRNRLGDRYCVLIANSDNAAEGIEFKCVRLHILADVPPLHSQYVQRASRSVRQRGHAALDPQDRDVRFVMFVAQLPDYARSDLGSFVLWSLCGYWSPAKRKTYTSSEPDAEDVEEAARQVLNFFGEHGIESIDELRVSDIGCTAADALEDKKLRTRLLQGIESLSNQQALRLPHDAHLTADERTLERLKGQARQLTPAVHRMRGAAVDAGCY